MFNVFVIGVGGFFGAIFRFAVSGFVHYLIANPSFPFGTLVVNFLGSLLLGGLSTLSDHIGFFNPEARSLIFIGFLGSFTTFSTFSIETYNLIQDSNFSIAGMNIVLNLSLCLLSVWLGKTIILGLWR